MNHRFGIATFLVMACAFTAHTAFGQESGGIKELPRMEKQNVIFPQGKPASSDFFIGTAFVNALVADTEKQYNCTVYDVQFEAGARNNWHKHSGGQILLVTDGKGFYQERGKAARLLQKGDVVQIRSDVEHWHGAAPDSSFTHIAINPNTQKGEVVWLEPVSETEYKKTAK